MKSKKKKPWSGRFSESTSALAEQFSSSIHYDVRLYEQDILQSIAYAKALVKAEVLSGAESKKIIIALEQIKREIGNGKATLKTELEDIHMNVEAFLIEKVGEIGKKLHAGRSRNDQVATDCRMYVKVEIVEIVKLINRFQSVLLDMAEKHIKVMLPGYTHMQRAQPVLLAHHFMAYYEMLQRDKERFQNAAESADVMTLGSGALAGTGFDIDRDQLADELGFSKISKNSIDAVSDRDFVAVFIFAASLLMSHLSRFSEELVIWSSYEFDFIELSDKYTTGSSIMPQKKNPDIAELCRGKTGRVYGDLVTILTVLKGLPLSYNRDLQEDKEPLFNSIDTIKSVLTIYAEMLSTMGVNAEIMTAAVRKGFLTATDLAYYLVRKGIPFREAHEVVGKIVAYCEESNMQLEYLSLQQLKQFSSVMTYDVTRILSAESSIANRDMPGGTASARVKEAIKRARKELLHDKA